MGNIYVVSDLHLGDGSVRDSFAYHGKRELFDAFLGIVEREEGAELFLLGDCFELWQGYGGKVFGTNAGIIDRLTGMPGARAVFGNHDAEFAGGGAQEWLRHEWFRSRTAARIDREIGGRRFTFAHGHEGDAFNDGDRPLSGNALAIFAGILEDRVGSRYLDPDGKVPLEASLTAFGDMILGFLDRLGVRLAAGRERGLPGDRSIPDGTRSPEAAQEFVMDEFRSYAENAEGTGERGLMDVVLGVGGFLWRQKPDGEQGELLNRHFASMRRLLNERKSDVVVCGHTHMPGRIGDWYRNSGSWSDAGSDVLRIDGAGEAAFFRCVRGAGGAALEEVAAKEFVFKA